MQLTFAMQHHAGFMVQAMLPLSRAQAGSAPQVTPEGQRSGQRAGEGWGLEIDLSDAETVSLPVQQRHPDLCLPACCAGSNRCRRQCEQQWIDIIPRKPYMSMFCCFWSTFTNYNTGQTGTKPPTLDHSQSYFPQHQQLCCRINILKLTISQSIWVQVPALPCFHVPAPDA